MKIRDIMREDVKTCRVDVDLRSAGQILGQIGIGVVPVVDDDRHVVGILTDRDLCLGVVTRNQRPSEIQAAEIMTRKVYTCRPGDDVRSALRSMREHGVRRLPVVDETGRLAGIVSVDDIVLASRSTGDTDLGGPFHAEVAIALQKIVEHQFDAQAATAL